ncbi:hypothetical protein GLYMA_20G087650v4 [Glycine max]|nr:hypothetical protein GLYMA_20G087650v4 [Glycine max]KAH1035209.1 hypothetical protein GYH30_055271 [Glycine max]
MVCNLHGSLFLIVRALRLRIFCLKGRRSGIRMLSESFLRSRMCRIF